MSAEAATELLFEAGCEFRHQGADVSNAAALLDTMLSYADPEYVEAASVLAEDALECFARGVA